MRLLVAIMVAAVALLALLKIATAFNDDYDTGDYGPVHARWDARSQAIITRADFVRRYKDGPAGSQALSQNRKRQPGRSGTCFVIRPAAD